MSKNKPGTALEYVRGLSEEQVGELIHLFKTSCSHCHSYTNFESSQRKGANSKETAVAYLESYGSLSHLQAFIEGYRYAQTGREVLKSQEGTPPSSNSNVHYHLNAAAGEARSSGPSRSQGSELPYGSESMPPARSYRDPAVPSARLPAARAAGDSTRPTHARSPVQPRPSN